MSNESSETASGSPHGMWTRFFESRRASPVSQLLKRVFADCQKIQNEAGDTRQITVLLQQLSIIYYLDVRRQAQLSFWSAFGAAVAGMLFFLYAIRHAMLPGGDQTAHIGLWAGGLTQFISAVNFLLYFRGARQFATFHVCLERTNRFLLADTMCNAIEQPARDEVRRALVDIVARAPMLALDGAGATPLEHGGAGMEASPSSSQSRQSAAA